MAKRLLDAQKTVRQIGVWKVALIIVALVIAAIIARYNWHLRVFIDAEYALFDARVVASAPLVHQDNRIVLVPYTDETLIAAGKRSPLDRTTLARALTRLDAMGAKAIGIDILDYQPQTDDPVLIAAFHRMHTPTFVAYASAAGVSDKILYRQQQFLDQFQQVIAGRNVHPASIMLQTDADNVVRRWPDKLPGAPPRLPNAMIPGASAFADYYGSLAYRRPADRKEPIFPAIPIDTFADDSIFTVPGATEQIAQQIRGRYVLIGGNIEDIDLFQTPLSEATANDGLHYTWGMDLFAVMLAQILDGRQMRPMSNVALWAIALAVVTAGALTAGVNRRTLVSVPVLVGQLLMLVGLPFWMAWHGVDTHGLPAFGWLVGWVLAFNVVRIAARRLRRFALEDALGKYLAPDIAARILRDPTSMRLSGERREIFVLFSDLEGFTELSHAIEPEMVAFLLNGYLNELCDVVLSHGGTIDKFVGDAIVAFWGTPVSRSEDGRKAVQAAIAIHAAGEKFRINVASSLPPVGRTRVGLHWGKAIVGNFGGAGRIQHTALGDAINTAARLESANKQTGTSVLISGEVVERSGLDCFRPLGRVQLSGRASAIDLYEPVPDMPASERRAFAEIAIRAQEGHVESIDAVVAMAFASTDDEALIKLSFRLTHQDGKSCYVLPFK